MAQPLTAAEKAKIRLYLGYQARFHQTDSSLEQAMLAVDVGDSATYDLVVALLGSLADVDTKLLAADDLLDVASVGDITIDAHGKADKIGVLRSKGRMFVGRLGSLLGVRVRHDYFAGAHPRGPFWGFAGMGEGGGNLPPLG